MKNWLRAAITFGLSVLLISGCQDDVPQLPSESTTPTDPTVITTVPPTDPPTDPPTVPPTEPPTVPPTEPPTVPPTEPPTVPPTEPPTVPPTEPPTVPPTEPPTVPPTEPPTVPPTEPPTVPPTEPPTESPTAPPANPDKQGWYEQDGKRYYYDENGNLYIGWLVLPEGVFYMGPDGAAVTGWTDLGDRTYYFHSDGRMHTGWLEENGKRYYFTEGGAMAHGWTVIDGQRYYFTADGAMYVGWLTRGEYDYYLHPDGTAATGKQIIDGQTRYFTPDGIHIVLVNPWNYVPGYYELDLVGAERDLLVSARCSAALKRMFADCRAAGCDPVLLSAYRSWETQNSLYQRKVQYYLDLGYGEADARYLAGQVVAVPGTSEHQLGLAVDIVDNGNWSTDYSQENTRTQKWMMEHCWEYGFILRYPNGTTGITGIIYEPWHYRYVGVEVAMAIRDSGLTLEEYLGAA